MKTLRRAHFPQLLVGCSETFSTVTLAFRFYGEASYIWPLFHNSNFLTGSPIMKFVELTDVVTNETTAVNLDEVTEIEAIASEPATVTQLTFEDGQVYHVHETISEIMMLNRMVVERAPPTELH